MSERSQVLDNAAVIQLMNERSSLTLRLGDAERTISKLEESVATLRELREFDRIEIERLKEFEWMYKDLCK